MKGVKGNQLETLKNIEGKETQTDKAAGADYILRSKYQGDFLRDYFILIVAVIITAGIIVFGVVPLVRWLVRLV